MCLKCNKSNLNCSIRYQNNDFCLECIDEFANIINLQNKYTNQYLYNKPIENNYVNSCVNLLKKTNQIEPIENFSSLQDSKSDLLDTFYQPLNPNGFSKRR